MRVRYRKVDRFLIHSIERRISRGHPTSVDLQYDGIYAKTSSCPVYFLPFIYNTPLPTWPIINGTISLVSYLNSTSPLHNTTQQNEQEFVPIFQPAIYHLSLITLSRPTTPDTVCNSCKFLIFKRVNWEYSYNRNHGWLLKEKRKNKRGFTSYVSFGEPRQLSNKYSAPWCVWFIDSSVC